LELEQRNIQWIRHLLEADRLMGVKDPEGLETELNKREQAVLHDYGLLDTLLGIQRRQLPKLQKPIE